jgi:phosphoglycolate phosphatase
MTLTPLPDAVVFDFDGPIIDSREPVRMALRAALREHGYPPRLDAELDAAIGPPTLEGLALLTGGPSDDLTPLAYTYHEHYGAVYLAHTQLVDGMAAVLSALSVPLALATAKEIEFTEPLLDALDVRACFAVVCAPALAGPPESKSVTVGRAILELDAARPVVVGDRRFDIEAARDLGVPGVGVTWGVGDRAELEEAGAEVIVSTPPELLALLQESGAD